MKGTSYFKLKSFIGVAVGAFALTSTVHAQDSHEINVLSVNDSNCAEYAQYNAEIFGYWPDAGVKTKLLPSETSVAYVAFLQNGDADLAMLDSGQILQAADAGLPIKVVYEIYGFAPEGIVVAEGSPIKGLADLKDVTIGLASDRDLITTIVALDSIGTTMEQSNVTTVVVGDSGPVLAAALRDGTVDAVAGGGPDRRGIEAAGVRIRNITPIEVSQNPGNSWVAWGPTLEEKREKIEAFLRGFAMAQHAGVVDTKLSASACRTRIPEQFEDLNVGMAMMDRAVYVYQIRRGKDFGELQPDVWAAIQPPYVKLGEISKKLAPESFLDPSFIEPANDFTLAEVKAGMAKWKEANRDKLID